MPNLRKANNAQNFAYFDPKCINGMHVETLASNFKSIKLHHVTGGDDIRVDVYSTTNIDQWFQANVLDLAGNNPDTSDC